MSDQDVPLGLALEALRQELATAMESGEGKTLRFRSGEIELTLQSTVTWTGNAEVGIKWWLVNASAGGSRSAETVQTVKLTLTPVRVDHAGRESDPLIDAPA